MTSSQPNPLRYSKNYPIIALLNIIRHKSYITIISLFVGRASFILILLWVQYEESYDRLNKNADITKVYKQHVPTMQTKFIAQPITSIHLSPAAQVDLAGHGNVQYMKILFIVAIFILIVFCINFMNFATTRAARRAEEVELRKVRGAVREQLIRQFLWGVFIDLVLFFDLSVDHFLLIPAGV